MTYAAKTKVPIESTRMEIERLLVKHKATNFMSAWGSEGGRRRAVIAFDMKDRRLLFELPLPEPSDKQFSGKSQGQRQILCDRASRSRWRGLLLTIKAKLESVESGIETFEEAFLAQVVLPGGSTMGKWAAPRLKASYSGTPMPKMLPGASTDDVIDADGASVVR